jgi:4-amino-4-deoxy-L-arabinose transferase-like glycosyltransferase
MNLPSPLRRWAPVCLTVVVGLFYRLWLMTRYAGWEESDYGNLAMVRGVLDGGFIHYDMHHMPGYYGLGAVVLAIVGDTVVAARSTSLIGGLAALGLAVHIAQRLGGRRAAWLTGLLLVLQPEFALYAASSLREPVYAAFLVGCLAALLGERLWLAGALAGLAFLTRMDGALVLAPVLAVHALGGRDRQRRLVQALTPLFIAVLIWAVYCRLEHGTFAFWGHSVQVNLDTGMGAESTSSASWWVAGGHVAAALGAWVLPWRIGWGVWLGAVLFLIAGMGRPATTGRTVGLAVVTVLGVWLGMGFVAQHAPTHNLYWKWLCPVVPVVVPAGVVGLLALGDKLARSVGWLGSHVLVVAVIAQSLWSYTNETERQRILSEVLYRPQLDLAQWIEAEVSPSTPLLLDNIPACWIRRRPTERRMVSWFDVPVPSGDASAFGRWIGSEEIGWVLWFRESWTQAPRVAPFLADGGTWHGGGVTLTEADREDDYGWILFQVAGPLGP